MGINFGKPNTFHREKPPISEKPQKQSNHHIETPKKKEIIKRFGEIAQLFLEQGVYSKEKVEKDFNLTAKQIIKFSEKADSNASMMAEKILPDYLHGAFSLFKDTPVVTASDASVYDDQNNRIDSVIFIADDTDFPLLFGVDVTVSRTPRTIQKKLHLSSNNITEEQPYGTSKLEYLVLDDKAIDPLDVFRFCVAIDSRNIADAKEKDLLYFIILSEVREQIGLITHKNNEAKKDPRLAKRILSDEQIAQLQAIMEFTEQNLESCINSLLENNEDLLDYATNPDNKEHNDNYSLIKDFIIDQELDRAYSAMVKSVQSEKRNELVCILRYSIRDGEVYLKDKRIEPITRVKKRYADHLEDLIGEPTGPSEKILGNDRWMIQ